VNIARRRRRTAATVLTMGFRAAPVAMTVTVLLGIFSGVAIGMSLLGVKLFVDAFVRHDHDDFVWAVVLLTTAAVGMYVPASLIGSWVGQHVISRASLYMNMRIAQLASETSGIEHFERPDYLRELDLLSQNGPMIGQASRQVTSILQSVLRLGFSVGLLMLVSPVLGLIAVTAVIPLLATRRAVRLRERVDEGLADDRRLINHLFRLGASAAPSRELRIYQGLSTEIRARHARLASGVNARVASANLRAALITMTGWLLYSLSFVGAAVLVTVRAVHGDATAGEVILVISIGRVNTYHVSALAEGITQLLIVAKTTHRYLWLQDYASQSTRRTVAVQPIPSRLDRGIAFDDVTFRYPGTDEIVLSHVSFEMPAGTTIALVGENGAGKTTIVKLLSGMYHPTEGRVLVDGVDLQAFDLPQWRERLAATFQDFARYELIAGETVGVGDLPRIGDADAIDLALRRADAADIIASLDDGLTTPLGRSFVGGRELSGGQWQKLALGRGMMRDGPLVLLLDEPTASLDPATEHALFERYAAASDRTGTMSGAITLLVSHRFSTVQMADLIIVLADSRIAEIGTHRELIANHGAYAELYELQARAYM
jgi:ATP-binding cassette subfamily B protein